MVAPLATGYPLPLVCVPTPSCFLDVSRGSLSHARETRTLRRFGCIPFRALRAFSAAVRGPTDRPPCSLQRPPRHKSRRLHGVPLRVFAPQVVLGPVYTYGQAAWSSGSSAAVGRPRAHHSAIQRITDSWTFVCGCGERAHANSRDAGTCVPHARGVHARVPQATRATLHIWR
jgi:hypothetical protein